MFFSDATFVGEVRPYIYSPIATAKITPDIFHKSSMCIYIHVYLYIYIYIYTYICMGIETYICWSTYSWLKSIRVGYVTQLPSLLHAPGRVATRSLCSAGRCGCCALRGAGRVALRIARLGAAGISRVLWLQGRVRIHI